MIEHLRPGVTANSARVVLFDFDGTLSTIRSGWVGIMVPMMVDTLAELKSGESEAELTEIVKEYVGRLTGKETIYQMMEFAEQISKRGGTPEEPKVYKKMYLDALMERIKDRLEGLENGRTAPEEWLVPGSRALLDRLKARGLKLYLASGTDHADVVREVKLLGLYDYFDGGVFGALDDLKAFSKAILVKKIVDSAEHKGEEFLAFGDGYVEVQVVKEVGGVAVGVASDEPACERVDDWKRNRLVGVGADWIVPHYANTDLLMNSLFPQ